VGGNTITASAGDFAFLPVESLIHSRTRATAMRRRWSSSLPPALKDFLRRCSSLRRIVPRCRRLSRKR
jgi:hypothetical protein